jgi:hypothetical protein
MSLGTILLIVLVLLLLGGGGWGHLNGAPWAGTYGNGGLGLGFILLIVVLVMLFR